MNLRDALKAVAPAVGDGKIVAQQAYVKQEGTSLYATDGQMTVTAVMDDTANFCVRHDALVRALEREIARVSETRNHGVIVQAGRGRTTLKGVDPDTFPDMMATPAVTRRNTIAFQEGDDFRETLKVLSAFSGGPDSHIWQMGVHFREHFAFAANAFSMVFKDRNSAFDYTLPPWTVRFIVAYDVSPIALTVGENTMRLGWEGLVLVSTKLIQDASDDAHSFIENAPRSGGVSVPGTLKEIVARLRSYGIKNFRLEDGKITHNSDTLEIEEEVDIDAPAKSWGVELMAQALEHAETIDLTGRNAVWHGGGYHGIFAGMAG